ncbi:GNAT family N-acetyltransferase, partial [Methylobacterium oryzisoli]
MQWRLMRPEDLPVVHRIGNEVHPPHLHEEMEPLRSRFTVGREFCFVLTDGSHVSGYLVGHLWDDTVPPLNGVLRAPDRPKTAFLHDLAVLPAARGAGAARAGVERFLAQARRCTEHASLVAVNASMPFWHRRGFRVAEA